MIKGDAVMKRGLLMFCLFSFSLVCILSSKRTECQQILWYTLTDPDATPPPYYPWDVMTTLPPDLELGDILWLSANNYYVLTNKTAWAVLIEGRGQEFDYWPGHHGYRTGNPPKQLFAQTLDYTNLAGGSREFHWEFIPQPDWQVGVLKKVVKENEDGVDSTPVYAAYQCYHIEPIGSRVLIANSWFGLAGVDTLDVTEIIIFPDEVPIDTMGSHILNAPGTWAREFVSTDPNGQPHPLGGVKWTSEEGIGLEAGVVFSLELAMTAAAASSYSLYAFDSESGIFYHFIIRTDSEAIPTLTEWGLIIFGVVLLGFISWVFVRRRKVASVRV
jgi:hypothetical protein